MKVMDLIILAVVALFLIRGLIVYRKNPCSGCGKNCENCYLRNIRNRTETSRSL